MLPSQSKQLSKEVYVRVTPETLLRIDQLVEQLQEQLPLGDRSQGRYANQVTRGDALRLLVASGLDHLGQDLDLRQQRLATTNVEVVNRLAAPPKGALITLHRCLRCVEQKHDPLGACPPCCELAIIASALKPQEVL
jgi:hypothetical protein